MSITFKQDANYSMLMLLNTIVIINFLSSNNFESRNTNKVWRKSSRNSKKNGLSQEELAYKAGLHRTYIGMIERAEKNVKLSNIEKIATALDISISKLTDFV